MALLVALSACSGNVKEELGLKREGPDEFAVERKPKLEVPPSFKLRPPAPGEEPLNVTSPRDSARNALIGEQPKPSESIPALEGVPSTDPLAGLTDATIGANTGLTSDTAPADATPTDTTPSDTTATDGASADKPATEANPAVTDAPKQPEPVVEKSEGENILLKNAGTESKDDNIRSTLKQEYKEEQDQGVLGTLETMSNNNFDKTVVDPKGEKERIDANKKENKPITEGETPAKSINHDKSFFEKIFN